MTHPFGGLRIVETDLVGDPYEDWSQVRAPSRARRRRAKGYPQRIVTRYRANGTAIHDKQLNAIYMHRDDRLKLERTLQELGS